MDNEWAVSKLDEFVSLVEEQESDEQFLQLIRNGFKVSDDPDKEFQLPIEIDRREKQLKVLEQGVVVILRTTDWNLSEYRELLSHSDPEGEPIYTWRRRWEPAREAALKAVGLLTVGAEAERRMRSASPQLVADNLHPWVWDAARPMWEAGSVQTAVQHAASSVNARLKQKVDRTDVSEAKLCAEAFSFHDPVHGKARLRFPGERNSDTWKALQGGAGLFGQGCFQAIRNPVAHDHEHPLTRQEALEQLAALSVLARWIELCFVEHQDDLTVV